MKKYLVWFILFLNTSAFGNVLDKEGKIRKEIVEVFWNFRKIFPASSNLSTENLNKIFPDTLLKFKDLSVDQHPTLQTLNEIAQKVFLRPKGEERLSHFSIQHYQKLSSILSSIEKLHIIDLFRTIGDIEQVTPTLATPNYILIQGSTVQNIRDRVMFMVEMFLQGKLDINSRPKIVFLSGERPLFDTETPEVLLNPSPYSLQKGWIPPSKLPTDESELSQFVWNQLSLPEEIRNLKPQFIIAEKKVGTSRAITEDAARVWLKKLDENKVYCWVVSNNPFIDYQRKVMEWMAKKYAPKKQLIFEGVGKRALLSEYSADIAIGILLDNLARTLYTLQQIKNI